MKEAPFRGPFSHSSLLLFHFPLRFLFDCDSLAPFGQFLSVRPFSGNQFRVENGIECDNRAILSVNLVTVRATVSEVPGKVALSPVVTLAPAANDVARVALSR